MNFFSSPNFRSDSGNTTNGNDYLSVGYNPSGSSYSTNSNSSTLERSSYKPASRSNSTNLFANNNDKDDSSANTTVIDNAVTNSNGNSAGSRKQSMDLSNGALDLTRRINETLARHGKFFCRLFQKNLKKHCVHINRIIIIAR